MGVVLAGRYSDVVRNMREVAPGAPNWLVDFLYYAIPNFRNFDFKDKVAYGDPIAWATFGFVTAYALVYIAFALTLGLLAFQKRDFQ